MKLAKIHLTQIRGPKFLLRPVRKNSVEYQEMVDSIKDNGLWQPILIRPVGGEYEVVEGNWRFNCCKQLHMKTIPCIVREMSDAEVLVAQLQCNGIRPETTPVEFAVRLEQLLKNSPDMTIPKLALLIRKSPTWVRRILRLRTLRPSYGKMVARGEIPVESAVILARLAYHLQDSYIRQAQTLSASEFVPLARAELKMYREASQRRFINGHKVNQPDPIPYLRKLRDIRAEYEKPLVVGVVLNLTKAETPIDGWRACLEWILHLDPKSVEDQKAMFEERTRQCERDVEKRKLERQRLRELRESGEES
jgi:ParB/RepB/Spo0J family partition protein